MALQPGPKQVNDIPLFGNRAIYALVDDTTLSFGKSATGAYRTDIKIFGSGTSHYEFYDASKNEISLAGNAMFHNPAGGAVVLFDHFLGDLIEDGWNVQADTGGTVNCGTAVVGGAVTFTTDGTDDDTALLGHELNWKASQGLIYECRFKSDVITTTAFFAGFSDAKVETSPNLAIGRATTVSVATATDAVGFAFDIDSTSDVIFGTGVKNGTLIADQGASTAFAAATWVILRVEVSTAGAATFYVNGVLLGTASVANAVTTTVALTPVFQMANRGAFAHVYNVDYILAVGQGLAA